MAETRHSSAATLESVRAHIRMLYENKPHIRIAVAIPHSKVVQNADVTITGVYPHVFCIEESVGGAVQRHTFQYVDVLTNRIEIVERDA